MGRGAPGVVTTAQVFQKKSLPRPLQVLVRGLGGSDSAPTFSPRIIDHSSIYDYFELQTHCGWASSSIKHQALVA
jgi:hypothetical protein